MQRTLIICDLFTTNFLNNKLFDRSFIVKFPGSAFWPDVYDFCIHQGWSIITSDVYLADEKQYEQYDKYLISEMYTPNTDTLIQKGITPLITFSQESPNVALKYHKNLFYYTGKYRHSILFSGLEQYANPSTTYHKLYWPNNMSDKLDTRVAWSEKKLLVMVASNKRRFDVAINRPLLSLRRILKRGYVQLVKATNPFFRFEDLYTKRIEAILHFSNVEGFALYGTLWDKPHGLNSKYYNAAKKLNPTRVDSKHAVLAQYKFNLCFENCVYPGYVTEKIFDCLLSGTIPVYFGAPDIANFVPKDCYLDFRDYDNFKDLQHALESMTEEEATKHLCAASDFVNSNDFKKYTIQNFSELFDKILMKEIGSHA
ncbi:glycosyltransferase family 10 [Pontibacter sp. BT731]|uniref:glycosyltransferase family 10 domain-containing protein n=1 Tax=Pontibacter coccineus TaxID=3063328 RepID=UPI0026E3BB83|nr:glycosyltransferase family 10 [Pontibacter sp. BT731]MDO6391149.1 glycosyltransferase family 10 [Pontibacter sp. BT731]